MILLHGISFSHGSRFENIQDHLFDGSLRYAYLQEIDLRGKDLRKADFQGANLYDAKLAGVDLREANLSEAQLCRADFGGTTCSCFGGTDLRGTNLRKANLHKTDLRSVKLQGADLTGTCLDPRADIPSIPDEVIEAAGLEIDGDRIFGWRTLFSQHQHVVCPTEYVPRDLPYVAPFFSVSTTTACHPGIYLASRAWLVFNYPIAEYVRCWCWRDELMHVKDKWRAKRIWVEQYDVLKKG